MTDSQLMDECKKALGIQLSTHNFDEVLLQKLSAVKSYMTHGGISSELIADDLAVGTIVLGVCDLWNTAPGEVKFSLVFNALLTQLAAASLILTVSSAPVEAADNVAVDVEPVLIFNKRISTCMVRLVEYDTQDEITITAELDITGKQLTITPSSNLVAGAKYAIVVDAAKAYSGPSLGYTVISFTTV